MNAIEILSSVIDANDGIDDLCHNLHCDPTDKWYPELPEGVTVKLVYEFGGGEGEGENVERVFSVTKNGETQYVQIFGFYSSYDGTDWDHCDEWTLAEPYEFTETRYRDKQ